MDPCVLRQKADECLKQAEGFFHSSADENRPLNDEEKAQVAALKAKAADYEQQAKDLDAIQSQRGAYSQGSGRPPLARVDNLTERFEDDPARGFATPRDFLGAIVHLAAGRPLKGNTGERLRSLAADQPGEGMGYMLPAAFAPTRFTAGSDEHGVYDDSRGGLFIRPQQLPGLMETGWEGDPTVGRTSRIDMQSPTVEFFSRVDKNHATSVTGGFRVYRTSETQESAASRSEYEKITLRASKLMGVAYATSELLNYSPISFISIIENGFRTEFGSKIIDEKMRGTGAGEYAGILSTTTNPALISVAKESAQANDTIVYANLVNMLARIWTGNNQAVWMVNSDAISQLMQLVNPAGQLIWQANAVAGAPSMLLGLPMIQCEACSAIGDLGDIVLANWREYYEGTLRPVESASSIHVRFLNDETAFRFTLSNAGAPAWRSALTPKYGSTKSPFVTLAAR